MPNMTEYYKFTNIYLAESGEYWFAYSQYLPDSSDSSVIRKSQITDKKWIRWIMNQIDSALGFAQSVRPNITNICESGESDESKCPIRSLLVCDSRSCNPTELTFERSFCFLEDNCVSILRILLQQFQNALNIFEADVLERSLKMYWES